MYTCTLTRSSANFSGVVGHLFPFHFFHLLFSLLTLNILPVCCSSPKQVALHVVLPGVCHAAPDVGDVWQRTETSTRNCSSWTGTTADLIRSWEWASKYRIYWQNYYCLFSGVKSHKIDGISAIFLILAGTIFWSQTVLKNFERQLSISL